MGFFPNTLQMWKYGKSVTITMTRWTITIYDPHEPYLSPHSVIVMNDVPYYIEINKSPYVKFRKANLITWLNNGIIQKEIIQTHTSQIIWITLALL